MIIKQAFPFFFSPDTPPFSRPGAPPRNSREGNDFPLSLSGRNDVSGPTLHTSRGTRDDSALSSPLPLLSDRGVVKEPHTLFFSFSDFGSLYGMVAYYEMKPGGELLLPPFLSGNKSRWVVTEQSRLSSHFSPRIAVGGCAAGPVSPSIKEESVTPSSPLLVTPLARAYENVDPLIPFSLMGFFGPVPFLPGAPWTTSAKTFFFSLAGVDKDTFLSSPFDR